ncbi:MAG: ferritin-like domain-containing protein [Rubrobacteridae bacterium]|nr:ferritin-like domain-containing protein [Rubrobacteridae bacterium]
MNRQEIIDSLNYLRSLELFSIQQYMNHYYRVKGQDFADIKDAEKSIALTEMKHAELLAEKINMLGGDPIYQPAQVSEMKGSMITEGESTEDMIGADLKLERNGIKEYIKAIKNVGDSDPGIRKLLEDILVEEEEHADTYSTWLGEDQAYEIGELRKAG